MNHHNIHSRGYPQVPLFHHGSWNHSSICCDQDHGGPASMACLQSHGNSHNVMSGSDLSLHDSNHDRTEDCGSECPLDTYCCGGDYCCDNSGSGDCCDDPHCEDTFGAGHLESQGHVPGELKGTGGQTIQSLAEWAGTPEGCNALQQLIECCNQPDCNIPVCPTDPTAIHPGPTDPLAAIFASLRPSPQPIASAPSLSHIPAPSPEEALHTCHWSNCHLIFQSMPDLLAHVAADHLSAWGSNHQPGQLEHQSHTELPTIMAIPATPSQQDLVLPPNLPHMQDMHINNSLHAADSAVKDALLACMWDDCFPSSEMPSTFSDALHSHTHNHNLHGYPPRVAETARHEHFKAAGEPVSPGTMLRHVLEEHLGIPPDIIGWPKDAELQAQPLQPGHHHHHIDPYQAQIAHSENCDHVHPHPHLHTKPHLHEAHLPSSPIGSHGVLPTPPNTVEAESSSSPPAVPAKSLICLWPGCSLQTPLDSTASLMDHLSDVHLPKGKDCYTCHWDGCGGEEGRVFKSRQKVLRHLQSHVGHKPFVCGICDQCFSEAAPLTAHMRRHAQEKPFKCEHPGCGKSFAIPSSLTIHARTHNGEKPFVCPHCQKGFVEASNLTKHIRTHTGERPFACAHPGCNKKFSRPDQLKRHMHVHNKAPGDKKRVNGAKVKAGL